MSYLAYLNYINDINRMRETTRITINGAENYNSMRFDSFRQRGNNDEINFKIGRDIEIRVVLSNNGNYTSGIMHLNTPHIGENEAQHITMPIGRNIRIGKFWYYLGRAIIQELKENNN